MYALPLLAALLLAGRECHARLHVDHDGVSLADLSRFPPESVAKWCRARIEAERDYWRALRDFAPTRWQEDAAESAIEDCRRRLAAWTTLTRAHAAGYWRDRLAALTHLRDLIGDEAWTAARMPPIE